MGATPPKEGNLRLFAALASAGSLMEVFGMGAASSSEGNLQKVIFAAMYRILLMPKFLDEGRGGRASKK
jgi:hypothetical protein